MAVAGGATLLFSDHEEDEGGDNGGNNANNNNNNNNTTTRNRVDAELLVWTGALCCCYCSWSCLPLSRTENRVLVAG